MKEEMDMQLHGYWQDGAVIQQGAPFTVTGRVQTARTITVRLMREEGLISSSGRKINMLNI